MLCAGRCLHLTLKESFYLSVSVAWPAEVTPRIEQPVDSSGGHGPLGCASLLFGLVVVSIHY